MGLSDPGSGDQHANPQMPTAISGLSAVRSRNVTRGLHKGIMLLRHYVMSLKCSESSERARQTGSTALKGTSRNAPKAIKRLSTRQRRRRIPRCPILPRASGCPRGVWVGQAAVGAAAAPDPTGRALPAPERQHLPVPDILMVAAFRQHPSAQCAATVQAHDPPEHRLVPAYRIRYCYSMSSGDHTAEELFFLRVFLGLGAEAGAGRDVGRWPNGRAGVARDRGCAAGRSGRWASPIRSAIGW